MPEKQQHEFERLMRLSNKAERLSRELGGEPTTADPIERTDILEVLKRYGVTEEEFKIQMKEFYEDYKICFKENINDPYNRNRCLIDKLKMRKVTGELKEIIKKYIKILEEINKKIYYKSALYEQINRMKELINY